MKIDKKLQILRYLSTVDKATTTEIIDNTNIDDYYCNGRFHVGNILSRLVNAGQIIRVKKGIFKFSRMTKKPIDLNRPKLF